VVDPGEDGRAVPVVEEFEATVNRAANCCSGALDAVLDFDAVLRDPEDPTRVAVGFDLGDHMHGNDIGYRALADAIDLGLFD
jgi:hypothetical protein